MTSFTMLQRLPWTKPTSVVITPPVIVPETKGRVEMTLLWRKHTADLIRDTWTAFAVFFPSGTKTSWLGSEKDLSGLSLIASVEQKKFNFKGSCSSFRCKAQQSVFYMQHLVSEGLFNIKTDTS